MALRSSTVASIVSTLMSGFNALTVRAAPSRTRAGGRRGRGEDIAGGLLRLFRNVGQQTAVAGLRAVRLAALGAVPLETVDHLVEANLLRSAGQLVPAVRPARRGDEAGTAQDHQHLVEKGARDPLAPGDLATLQRATASMARQLEDSPHAVFGFHRKAHAHRT